MAETYTGQVVNGVIVLDEGTPPLPEGTRLRVEVETGLETPRRKSLAERYAPIVGIAEGLPADMAAEHDHYIHGTPRRGEG
jgi:hypothetical protein